MTNAQQFDADTYTGRQVFTKVVEVRVLPSRGSNHIRVTGGEALMMMCGRKADRILALSGWLSRHAQGGRYQGLIHGRYKFNKKISRLLQFLPKREVGLVRKMDKTLGGTWMARKKGHPPAIRVRLNRNREKGEEN